MGPALGWRRGFAIPIRHRFREIRVPKRRLDPLCRSRRHLRLRHPTRCRFPSEWHSLAPSARTQLDDPIRPKPLSCHPRQYLRSPTTRENQVRSYHLRAYLQVSGISTPNLDVPTTSKALLAKVADSA